MILRKLESRHLQEVDGVCALCDIGCGVSTITDTRTGKKEGYKHVFKPIIYTMPKTHTVSWIEITAGVDKKFAKVFKKGETYTFCEDCAFKLNEN